MSINRFGWRCIDTTLVFGENDLNKIAMYASILTFLITCGVKIVTSAINGLIKSTVFQNIISAIWALVRAERSFMTVNAKNEKVLVCSWTPAIKVSIWY